MGGQFDRWTGSHHGIMVASRSGVSRDDGRPAAWSPNIGREPDLPTRAWSSLDDRAIVAAVLDGDRDAFRRLVERESAGLVRACHRILGDRSEAEDAAQEAFVTAYRSLATWRGDGPFGAWLVRIGVRIALRQVGRRRAVTWTSPRRSGDAGDPASGAADRAAERAAIDAAPSTDPAMLSVRAERATSIRSAVSSLPEPYREVVVMRFFGDATLEEIARQTGRPLGTVKTHLHRGLARLRSSLDGERR